MGTEANWPLTIFLIVVVLGAVVWFIRVVYRAVGGMERSGAAQTTASTERELDVRAESSSQYHFSSEPEEFPVKIETLSLEDRISVDLRHLRSTRLVIRGASNWIGLSDRARWDGDTYALLREPGNAHDANAVAVHHKSGRKLGYVSRSRAEAMAPVLDSIGFGAFIVGGGFDEGRLRVDIPLIGDLRTFAKAARSATGGIAVDL